MILKAFSLLDTKTGAFGAPFFMHHAAAAIRACIDLGGDLNTTVGRHPSDYALCEIGAFDDQTGVLQPIPPHNLGTVAGFLPAPTQRGPLFQPVPAPAPVLNGHAGGEG